MSWADLVRGKGETSPTATAAVRSTPLVEEFAPASPPGSKSASHRSDAELAALSTSWNAEQLRLAALTVLEDTAAGFRMPWDSVADDLLPPLRLVGGADISFVKNTDHAVASIVVLDFATRAVVHTVMHHCDMPVPYIPGYLAFREVDPLREALCKLRAERPDLMPQVIFVDGNGVLHYRRCGLATHLGVVCDVPTIGVAKEVLAVDGLGRDKCRADLDAEIERLGGAEAARNVLFPLYGNSGQLLGYQALTGQTETNAVYISAGHRISQRSAARLALLLADHRIIEPIRQADLLSRKFIQDLAASAKEARRGRGSTRR